MKSIFQCSKRHEFLCPEKESKGSCTLTRCPYPHRTPSQSSTSTRTKLRKRSKVIQEEAVIKVSSEIEADKSNIKRYFADEANNMESTFQTKNTNSENEKSAKIADDMVDDNINVNKRSKLGELPSFIPIG